MKWWMLKMHSWGYRNPDDGNGNQNGGSGGEGADGNGGKADDNGSSDKGAGDKGGEGDGGKKISDEEARLLKEVMQKKDALKKSEADLAAAQQRLKEFEGVDPAEIKKLLADRKAAEEAQLAAKGEFETLKARMAEEHTKVTKVLQDENAQLKALLAQKDKVVDELSIGQQFSQSKFIADELTLTASKARTIYGAHFDLEDGKVIAYDKPRGAVGRAPLVDQYGNNVGFDEALRQIVEADPEKEALLRSKVKQGAGSDSKTAGKVQQKADQPTDSVSKIGAGLKGLNLLGSAGVVA